VNVTSTWLTTSKGLIPEDAPLQTLFIFWPITLAIGIGLLLLTGLFWLLSRTGNPPNAPLSAITPRDRTRLLNRLQAHYQQILAQSLQGAVQLELGLATWPAAVHNATLLALRLPEQEEQVLPAHTSIVEVYEQAQHELLILGEPGSGKSTVLLELAHYLIEQAKADEMHPLPVILPLSSWANKCLPFQEWLI
jgi:hypothetical protein